MKRSVFPRIGCTMTIILKLVMPKIDPYSHKKKLHELDAFEGICVIVAEQFTTILPSFLFKKKKSEIFLQTAVSYGITPEVTFRTLVTIANCTVAVRL